MDKTKTNEYSLTTQQGEDVCIYVKETMVVAQVISGKAPLRQHKTLFIRFQDIRPIGFIGSRPDSKTFIISSSYDDSINPIIKIDGIIHTDMTLIMEKMVDYIISRL